MTFSQPRQTTISKVSLSMTSLYGRAAWAVGLPASLWCVFLALAVNPYIQKQILYANKVFPWSWWQDSNHPQPWGFASAFPSAQSFVLFNSPENQVTPFHITTDDGEHIHAWHILPGPLYLKHEKTLWQQPTGHCGNITATESFRLLKEDPEAKLIIYLHGNAGHLPTTIRPPSFHALTDMSSYHLLAIDYRGFGRSTGEPSEEGLIRDASAAVDFALATAGVAPNRVILLGHSLGTAVAVAVAERYADLHAIDFAGLILIAGFSSLPTMLSHYAIAGCVPILGPLRSWPRVLQWVLGFVVEPWSTADRLARLVNIVHKANGRRLRLGLIHAADDWDIPSVEDDKLFFTAVKPLLGSEADEKQLIAAEELHTFHLGDNAFVTEWRQDNVVIRQERFPYGGHNGVVKYAPVMLEVMRIFNEVEER